VRTLGSWGSASVAVAGHVAASTSLGGTDERWTYFAGLGVAALFAHGW
jgi:hypothetical protein